MPSTYKSVFTNESRRSSISMDTLLGDRLQGLRQIG
jgi:hypothetical protein